MDKLTITKAQRKVIKDEAGIGYVRVIGGNAKKMILEGRDNSGIKWQGTLREDQAAVDIDWEIKG